jgi:hypothetical protein
VTAITVTHPSTDAGARNAICLYNDSGSPVAFFSSSGGNGTNLVTDTPNVSGAPKTLLLSGVNQSGTGTWDPDDPSALFADSSTNGGPPVRTLDGWWAIRQNANSCANNPCNADGTLTNALGASSTGHSELAATYRWGGDLAATVNETSSNRVGSAVRLSWSTFPERDVAGYRVYRQPVNGQVSSVGSGFIAAKGDAFTGSFYTFQDTSAPAGATFYWIETVGVSGDTTRHGPILVAPAGSQSGLEEVGK